MLEKGNGPVEMIFIAAELPPSQLAVVALRGKMILNDSFQNKWKSKESPSFFVIL